MNEILPLSSSLLSHRLLRRQVRRIFGKEIAVDGPWAEFLEAVNDAYHEADREKLLVENALEVNAQELTEANIKLRLLIDNAPAGKPAPGREIFGRRTAVIQGPFITKMAFARTTA